MIIMPGNDRGCWWGYLAGKYPGRMGSLVSPGWWKSPVPFAPYAIDNGAFCGFKEKPFVELLEKAKRSPIPPLWVAVPDKVADKTTTIAMWKEWMPRLTVYGWPMAFVVQDGMTPDDVPLEATAVFVGGSDNWKFPNLKMWTDNFENVHVGRVNTLRHLVMCEGLDVSSCDGTGWFRSIKNTKQLVRFLDGERLFHTEFDFCYAETA